MRLSPGRDNSLADYRSKIHELLVNLAIADAPAPNTIAKYLPGTRKPLGEKQLQSWKTFLRNQNLWSMDHLQRFLANANIESVRTNFKSPWQNGICERLVGIIRREVLGHIIPLNQNHLERILRDYVNGYYNPHRTHQGIGCETPDASPRHAETKASEIKLVSKGLLGGLYHTYTRAA